MRVLLGSGGFRSEERRANLHAEMRDFFGETVEEILFIPYALHDHEAYTKAMRDQGFSGGYAMRGIHEFADPKEAVEQAQAIYVGGGNSFRLIDDLHRHALLDPIRAKVQGGMPYMGVSAGTNVACPTMMTTNDMPIVQPPSFQSLGLVPYQVNAHYFAGQTWVKQGDTFQEHFGETRDDRIREFHERNATTVIGLYEGGFLRNECGVVQLKYAPAVLFRPGQPAQNLEAGFDISDALA